MKKSTTGLVAFLLFFLLPDGPAEAGLRFELGEGRDLEIFQSFQIWAVDSFPRRRDANGVNVEIRVDLYLRRARLGVRGRIAQTLKYRIENDGRVT